jgi:hypothetical protein
MKIKQLIMKMYKACIRHDRKKEEKLWKKAIKKSLKHKKTQIIQ